MTLILAFLIHIHAAHSAPPAQVPMVLTAYSPETAYGLTRWTERKPEVGVTAACPVAWKMRRVYIRGFGWRVCEDTPARDTLFGLSHVDIFMPSRERALEVGIRALE